MLCAWGERASQDSGDMLAIKAHTSLLLYFYTQHEEITYSNSFKPGTFTSQRALSIDCAASPPLWWIFREL